jgi:tetratricopeptide (TPR) repeat protein
MQKSQYALIAGAILLVILLFQLPKALVKSKNQAPVAQNQKDTLALLPSTEVSQESRIMIADLTKKLNSVSNPQKKVNFADSLAAVYRKLHRFDSAAILSELALSLDPSEKRTIQTGQDFYEAFQFAQDNQREVYQKSAQKYFSDVLAKNPDNLNVKVDLAMTYVSSESPMTGIKLLKEVTEKDPNNEKAIFQLGTLSIQSGQFDKAVKRFEDLLKVNPNHILGNFYLGVSLLKSGDMKKAKEYLLKAKGMDQDPEFQASVESYLNEIK